LVDLKEQFHKHAYGSLAELRHGLCGKERQKQNKN